MGGWIAYTVRVVLASYLSMQVMEERRSILSKLQMVNIPDRMMALQSVIAETIKVGEHKKFEKRM